MVNVSSVGSVNTEKSHDNKNITHIFIKIYISSICLITFVTSLCTVFSWSSASWENGIKQRNHWPIFLVIYQYVNLGFISEIEGHKCQDMKVSYNFHPLTLLLAFKRYICQVATMISVNVKNWLSRNKNVMFIIIIITFFDGI